MGGPNPPLYPTWNNMLQRCYNERHKSYPDYGARRISVCDEWQLSFEKFVQDMGPRPEGYTLDRKDVDGDYCPENCRWASRETQLNNRRNTRHVTALGRTMSIAQWARERGMNITTLHMRLHVSGWCPTRALLTPVKKSRRKEVKGHV